MKGLEVTNTCHLARQGVQAGVHGKAVTNAMTSVRLAKHVRPFVAADDLLHVRVVPCDRNSSTAVKGGER